MSQIVNRATTETAIVRLLRCQKTRRYFTGKGWTEDPKQAKQFTDEFQAAGTCIYHDLHDVELVLRASGGDTDLFTTPIR